MATYYVRPTNGSDGNLGTSFANAWKTTAFALSSASAGDEIRLCAEAIESITTTISNTLIGGINSDTRIRGMDGTDGTTPAKYTIQAAAGLGANPMMSFSTNDYQTWVDVEFDANDVATYCIYAISTGALAFHWVNCHFHNATSDGVLCSANSAINPWSFVGCEMNNNGGSGIAANASAQGEFGLYGCSIHDNTSHGVNCGDMTVISGCLIYDNGSRGIQVDLNGSDGSRFSHNTIYGNSSDGLYIGSSVEQWACDHNIFVENGGYGLNCANNARENWALDWNHFHNNTSGHTNVVLDSNINDGTMGSNNQTGDPLFTLTTDGSENFAPLSGSPLIGNGAFGTVIGAISAVGGSTPVTKVYAI